MHPQRCNHLPFRLQRQRAQRNRRSNDARLAVPGKAVAGFCICARGRCVLASRSVLVHPAAACNPFAAGVQLPTLMYSHSPMTCPPDPLPASVLRPVSLALCCRAAAKASQCPPTSGPPTHPSTATGRCRLSSSRIGALQRLQHREPTCPVPLTRRMFQQHDPPSGGEPTQAQLVVSENMLPSFALHRCTRVYGVKNPLQYPRQFEYTPHKLFAATSNLM